MTSGLLPRLHFMQRYHAIPRLLERCRDISLPLVAVSSTRMPFPELGLVNVSASVG